MKLENALKLIFNPQNFPDRENLNSCFTEKKIETQRT